MPVQHVAPAIPVGINLNKDGIPDVLQQPQVSHAAPIQHTALAQKRTQVNHAAQARNELGLHSRRLSALTCKFAVIRSPSSLPSLHPQLPPTQEGVGERCGRADTMDRDAKLLFNDCFLIFPLCFFSREAHTSLSPKRGPPPPLNLLGPVPLQANPLWAS